jgi:hypothetical protein
VRRLLSSIFVAAAIASPAVAHARAGSDLPTGGFWWVDHYAQSHMQNAKGWSAFAGLHPYGKDTDNTLDYWEFNGSVRRACATTTYPDWVNVSGTSSTVEISPIDSVATATVAGEAAAYSCYGGQRRPFVLTLQLASTAAWDVYHYPPRQCPFLTTMTSGCVSMYRDGETSRGDAQIVASWWWCDFFSDSTHECMTSSSPDTVYRRGQVVVGKEVVLYQPGLVAETGG